MHGTARLILFVCLAMCSQSLALPQDEPAIRVFGSRIALSEFVGDVLRASNELTEETEVTVELTEGEPLVLPARKKQKGPSSLAYTYRPNNLSPLKPEVPKPVGELVVRYQASDMIRGGNILVTNEGRVIVAGNTVRFSDDMASPILDVEADHLQLNADGTKLLVQSHRDVWVLEGGNFEKQRLYKVHPPGIAWFALEPGRLLFVSETINLSAAAKRRIRLEAAYFDLETEEKIDAAWKPFGIYAKIGTMPQAGIRWGHLAQPYKIDPTPASIVIMDDGTPIDYLTTPNEAADIRPAADSERNLFWIRTYRRGGGTGRAFTKQIGKTGAREIQLTSLPTHNVTVSPNGKHIAYSVTNGQFFEIYRILKDDFPNHEETFRAFAAADRAMISKARGLMEDIRAALLELPAGAKLQEGGLGEELSMPPDEKTIDAMAGALRASLRSRFGLTTEPGMMEIANIDYLLDEMGDYLSETPPLIIALGGVVADAMPEGTRWFLDDAYNTLSLEVNELTSSDDMTYTALLPFGIARERLAGKLKLTRILDEITELSERPLYMVEHFSPTIMQAIETEEWRRSGMPMDTTTFGDFYEQLKGRPGENDVVNLIAISTGRAQQFSPLELRAAANLAKNNPASPEALRLLARTLSDLYYTHDALKLYRQAASLAPDDPHLRLAYADMLFRVDDLEEARKQYEIARRLDQPGVYTKTIEGRVRLIDNSKSGD